ncbi:16S rRNA (cytidine(1402)-2'-O)-methyltransferase [Candidatus Falkowbacteria bacterium]|nr:16S rRNA (cytidine(1402)-2'-O)-methyltransferase [Candidatus Falkowbacteria bacterium]
MATLYIVATPIGNLKDMTFRAVETLKGVDLILCEDTRQTKKLLDHYSVSTPTLSYHQHSQLSKIDLILQKLEEGKDLALVSDAGTPGISDPGNYLIRKIIEKFGDQIKITPIPGSVALAALVSISGFHCDDFLFLGFLPHKKGRQTLLKEIKASQRTIVLYESCHRINKLFSELLDFELGGRAVVVGRELTKQFETIYRGQAVAVAEQLKNGVIKGEFAVIIAGR